MRKLVYRVILQIPPVGYCIARMEEYPDFTVVGGDFNELMHKVQTEIPEYLFMMGCIRRCFRMPMPPTKYRELNPGEMVYYIEVSVPELQGKTHAKEVRLTAEQWDDIKQIIDQHPHFSSYSQFISWAVTRSTKDLLIKFWEDHEPNFNTPFEPSSLQCILDADRIHDHSVHVLQSNQGVCSA